MTDPIPVILYRGKNEDDYKVAFEKEPPGSFEKTHIGKLGKQGPSWIYIQTGVWPYPEIGADHLREIAAEIDRKNKPEASTKPRFSVVEHPTARQRKSS